MYSSKDTFSEDSRMSTCCRHVDFDLQVEQNSGYI
jgi:hypothetical protein